MRYLWVAYKKGCLKDMGPPFTGTELSAEDFKRTFQSEVVGRYHGAWTMFATTARGFIPVGAIFAFHSHFDHILCPFMIVGDLVWFPWASARNRIESAVNFFNRMRNDIPMVDYAHGEVNKKFFEMVCRHGVMRRVGTTFNVVRGEPVAIFETRATDKS